MEIERAFEVRDLPTDLGPATTIEQRYVAIDGDTEVRVRRADDRCVMTVKGGRGRERTEVEFPIERSRFDELATLDSERRILKHRHRIELEGGLVAELDRFGGDLSGLDLVEVEFDNSADADAFVAPSWFGPEVTDRAGWSNAELATNGLPQSEP